MSDIYVKSRYHCAGVCYINFFTVPLPRSKHALLGFHWSLRCLPYCMRETLLSGRDRDSLPLSRLSLHVSSTA